MKLLGYSERGLVNALSYDCLRAANGESHLARLLNRGCFPLAEPTPDFDGLHDATLFIEQSLSDFGDCDLIATFDSKDGQKTAVFCEFKRGRRWTLKKEWKDFSLRIENNIREDLTSNLFCQLYFKQRLSAALLTDSTEDIVRGLQFDEPLNVGRGNGCRKIGKNTTVAKAIEYIRPYAANPFFLMVTPDEMVDDGLREFLERANNKYVSVLGCSICRWGHLRLSNLKDYCEHNQPAFKHVLDVFDYNADQL